MDRMKPVSLKLRTRTLLTFENKTDKAQRGLTDTTTDPTTSTVPTTSGVLTAVLLMATEKK
jgi:hypothetical protein